MSHEPVITADDVTRWIKSCATSKDMNALLGKAVLFRIGGEDDHHELRYAVVTLAHTVQGVVLYNLLVFLDGPYDMNVLHIPLVHVKGFQVWAPNISEGLGVSQWRERETVG